MIQYIVRDLENNTIIKTSSFEQVKRVPITDISAVWKITYDEYGDVIKTEDIQLSELDNNSDEDIPYVEFQNENKYYYSGPVFRTFPNKDDKIFICDMNLETTAKNLTIAIRNMEYQAKTKLGLVPNTRVQIDRGLVK